MSSNIDPTKLKVVDLRSELTSRGLDSKGNKAVLIKRLKDALDKEANREPASTPVTAEDQDAAQDEKMEVEEPAKVEPVKPPEKTRERRRSTAKAAEKKPEPKIEPKIIEKPEPAAAVKPKPPAQSPEKPKVEQPNVKPAPEKPKAETHLLAVKPKSDSPVKTRVESPVKVKQDSPVKVKQDSPVKVKQDSPVKIKQDSPVKVKQDTPAQVKQDAPVNAPQESPGKVKDESPLKIKTAESPVKVLSESPVKIKAEDIQELDKEKSAENGAEDSEVDKNKIMTNEGGAKEEAKDETMKEECKGVETERRGDKRKRSISPERSQRKHSPPPRSPVTENEPAIDSEKVQLSWYDSDLHLQVESEKFLSAKPMTDGAFSYVWAGVRATHGISTGQVCYEVKITEEMKFDDFLKHESQRSQNKGRDRYKTDHRRKEKVKRSSDKRSREQKSKDKKDDDLKAKDDSSKEETDKNEDSKQVDQNESISDEKNESVNEGENESTHDENVDAATEEKIEDAPMETEQFKDSESMDVTPAEGDDQSADASKVKSDEKLMETDDVTEAKDQKDNKPDDTKAPELESIPSPCHLLRVGWSLTSCSLQLGEGKFSYGYESSGKFVTDNQSTDYGIKFALGDVVGAFLDIGEDEVVIRYTVNGAVQPIATTIPKSDLPEGFVLFPHVITHNCSFELNFGDMEEAWFAVPDDLEDHTFLSKTEDKVAGPSRPVNRSDCEVIMMWGLLACGKTHWVNEHVAANPDKRYNVIGNSSFMKKVAISCEPLKSRIRAIFVDKIQKCLNRLVWLAPTRRRNYIIDQTNVFQAGQRRKMQPFEGFKRRAVIIVLEEEEQTRRQRLQARDNKDVPVSTILQMKAAMFLPEKCEWFDEIIYPELGEEEAKEVVKKYNALGKEAGYGSTKRFKHERYDRRSEYRGRSYHERSSNYRRYEPKRGWSSQRSRGGGGSSWNRDRRDSRTSSSRDWRPSSGYSRDRGYRDSYSEHRSHSGHGSSRGYQGSGGSSRSYGGSRGGGHRGQIWSSSGSGNWSQGGWNQQTFGSGNYGSQHFGSQQYNKGGGQGYGNWNYGQHGQGSWNSQK